MKYRASFRAARLSGLFIFFIYLLFSFIFVYLKLTWHQLIYYLLNSYFLFVGDIINSPSFGHFIYISFFSWFHHSSHCSFLIAFLQYFLLQIYLGISLFLFFSSYVIESWPNLTFLCWFSTFFSAWFYHSSHFVFLVSPSFNIYLLF